MRNLLTVALMLLLFISCKQEVVSGDENVSQQETVSPQTQTEVPVETPAEVVTSDDYISSVKALKAAYQKELDTGVGMLQASIKYHQTTNDMMEVVYKKVLSETADGDKKALEAEQKLWLKNKETAFNNEMKKGEAIYEETGVFPELEKMVAYNEAADYNYNRIIALSEGEMVDHSSEEQ